LGRLVEPRKSELDTMPGGRFSDRLEMRAKSASPTYTPRVSQAHLHGVSQDFNAAGIKLETVDDLKLSRWKKLIWNVPYNGLSVVLNQTTDVMMADPTTYQRIEGLMHEIQAAAHTVDGRIIEDAFIQTMLSYTRKMKPYKTSMMLDHEAGRPLETQAIVCDPLHAAQACGLDTPLLKALYDALQAL